MGCRWEIMDGSVWRGAVEEVGKLHSGLILKGFEYASIIFAKISLKRMTSFTCSFLSLFNTIS